MRRKREKGEDENYIDVKEEEGKKEKTNIILM